MMIRSILAVLVLAFSVSATAQTFDYNHMQLDYGIVDFDNVNVDGDGIGLSGSFAVNPNWHVFAGFLSADLDFDVDATTFGAGIGYNTDLSPTVDIFARVSYESIDLDPPGPGSFDDSGIGLGVGLRFATSQELELHAGIDYVDFGDGGDDTGLTAGGLYNFSDAFAVGLSGSWTDDTSAYTLSGRYYFGK